MKRPHPDNALGGQESLKRAQLRVWRNTFSTDDQSSKAQLISDLKLLL